jgi:hypothetical protein
VPCLLIISDCSLSLLPPGLPAFEDFGLVYSGGACVLSCTPNPVCVVVPPGADMAAALLDSPDSSFEGMCMRWASEISVGERTGPGLVGGPCLKFPLRVRPCRASG